MFASNMSTVHCSISVDPHEVVVPADAGINEGFITPRDTGIRNKYVQATIEVFDRLGQALLNSFVGCDIHFVSLAWSIFST